MTGASLESLASRAIEGARAAGAQQAEACLESLRAFTVRVDGGKVESLKQSGTRGLGLRVIVDDRVGFVSSTDLEPASLAELARRAVAIARFSTADPATALPTPEEAGDGSASLDLVDPEVVAFPPEKKIEMALELERLTLAHDLRIRRTDAVSVSSRAGEVAIVNSNGVSRTERGASFSAYSVALADDRDGKQQSGGYGVTRRWFDEFPPLAEIAAEAGRRAVSRIGASPVAAARVPVILHPDVAASWLSEMFDAFSGESVIKNASWLAGKLGETIASPLVTLVDDGRMRRGVGSEAFDGEGVATRRNLLVDRGKLLMFVYDTYHARRAGTRSTGSAARSYASVPGIGYHNLYIEAGAETPEAILARVDRGFYMDDQGSYGFNSVTGEYSFQAQGHWIEKGEKVRPVEGVTVASNSLEMLRNVIAVGNDLRFDHAVAAPTLLIAEMTVSGGAE